MEFILCQPTTPGHKAYPGVWLIYLEILHQRKLTILSQQVSIANSFLVKGRTFCPLLLLHAGLLSGLNLGSYSGSGCNSQPLSKKPLLAVGNGQMGIHNWMNPEEYLATGWLQVAHLCYPFYGISRRRGRDLWVPKDEEECSWVLQSGYSMADTIINAQQL